jgi:hypothetical protein
MLTPTQTTPTRISVPVAGLPGWTETDVAPRLTRLDHAESGASVMVRSVGWGRPRPFVIVNGSESRFGTLSQACEFALSQADPVCRPGYLLDSDLELFEPAPEDL